MATADGCTVLRSRATEFEADLPYALWTEALDAHLADAGERRLSRLGVADPARSRHAAGAERRRAGAVTATGRIVRCAISSSVSRRPARSCCAWTTSTGPIRRRSTPSRRWCTARRARRCCSPWPPARARPPRALATALSAATAEDRVTGLVLAPLSEAEAAELVGEAARDDL